MPSIDFDNVNTTIYITTEKWRLVSSPKTTYTLRTFGTADGGVFWLGFSKSESTAPVGSGVPFRESVMLSSGQNELAVWGRATNSTQRAIEKCEV